MLILEKILFYLLIFCLPLETRTILYEWTSSFNEWTSAFLYFTDLLIIALLVFWFWRAEAIKKWRQLHFPYVENKISAIFLLFLLTAFISLAQASNFWLSFYQWLKLLEFALLFFYLRYNVVILSPSLRSRTGSAKDPVENDKSTGFFGFRPQNDSAGFHFERLAQVFIVSGLFQSIIAIGQYAKQASLGLWWFRESPLSPDIIGVAKIVVDGTKMIRAYGTFPHPNILAAFLLIALFFLYYLWFKNKIHYSLLIGFFGILSFALFLTFSRTIILVFLSVSLLYFIFLFKKFRKKVLYLFLLIILYPLLFTALAWPEISSRFSASLTDQAIDLRAFYNQEALLMIKSHPFLGIGLGNFVWQIREIFDSPAWLFQPVHNIYLLIASETGLIGLGIFLLFIIGILMSLRALHQSKTPDAGFIITSLLFIVFSFLLIGLFDHFFWTLQQGQLMFWVLLGALASFNYKPRTK